jgi:signal transduction histidine kinase
MNLRLFKTIDEHFNLKLFVVFGIMSFLIIGLFTAFYVFHYSNSLTGTMIKRGLFQAEMLANNSRIGVFSENEDLLNQPVESIFLQDEILEVLVFNLEGRLLKRMEKAGHGIGNGADEQGEVNREGMSGKFMKTTSSFFLEGRDRYDFYAPVLSVSSYSVADSVGLEETEPRENGLVIGSVMVSIDKGVLKGQVYDLLMTSIIIVILFMAAAFLASYLAARSISRPLNRLKEGVYTIGRGDVVEKLPVETRDEIGLLAEAFNDMSESLKRRENDLKRANWELLKEHEQRKVLSKRLIDLLERDRDRVAMELHDNIGQILTSLKINLEVIQGQIWPDHPQFESRIRASREKTVQALTDIKNISRGLKPSIMDSLGLASSLRELFNEIERDTGIVVRFFSAKVPERFEKEKELAIYRITQEALHNIVKYAHASTVFINLVGKDESISLSVEDNGVGFNLEKTMKIADGKGPFGLLIMRERAIQLQGEFSIESDIGKGTHLMVEIPI